MTPTPVPGSASIVGRGHTSFDRHRVRRGALAALTVCLLMRAAPVSAYRDLTNCPTLHPLEPSSDRGSRSCALALVREGRRILSTLVEAQDLPDVRAITAAIAKRCTPEALTTRGACANTPDGVARCLVDDAAAHLAHVHAERLGEAATDAAAAEPCADTLTQELARFVRRASAAMTSCAVRGRSARSGSIAARCLGTVDAGARVPPTDTRTVRRLTRAEMRLRRAIAACSDATIDGLDTCAPTAAGAATCLTCVAHREALLTAQGILGGTATTPAVGFIDWATIRNPVLGFDDRMLKDQAVVYDKGTFFIFSSTRYETTDPDIATKTRPFFTTTDWHTFVPFTDDDLNPPGDGPGSPDVVFADGTWFMTYQAPSLLDPADRQIALSTSTDLLAWTPPVFLAPDLQPNDSIIDGAIAFTPHGIFQAYKWRDTQQFRVTRAISPTLDFQWLPPLDAFPGGTGPRDGFAENYQLITIDGRQRMVATARDPRFPRCPDDPIFQIYTCDHEPFIYRLDAPSSDLTTWQHWTHKTFLDVPFEAWNPIMHANTGHLADWREHDGFFYLSYAGSADGDRFELRSNGRLGLARSRDLVHWRVPGDLRD